MSILVANEHRDLDKRKVVAPSRYEVVGYFIAAINILLFFSLSRVRVSRERLTTGRWRKKTRELPNRASSTCTAARGFHCRETVRFSRLVSVLLSFSPLTVRTEAKCRRWSGCRFESRTRTWTPFTGA